MGGACVLVGALTIEGWWRYRDRTRALLALSIALLCACGVSVATGVLTGEHQEWISDVTLGLLLGSGWALLAFRAAMTRIPAAVGTGTAVAVLATILLVCVAGVALAGAGSNRQPLIVALLGAVWLTCVAEPAAWLWRISKGMPSVQRARLRSISLAYGVVIVVLIVSIVSDVVLGGSRPAAALAIPALVVLPLFYIGFEPPRWLRAFWRQRDEGNFREAFNDLVLYSPDRQRLAERAVEWAARLVGADGAVIATDDGEVLAVHGIEREAGWTLVSDGDRVGGGRVIDPRTPQPQGVDSRAPRRAVQQRGHGGHLGAAHPAPW